MSLQPSPAAPERAPEPKGASPLGVAPLGVDGPTSQPGGSSPSSSGRSILQLPRRIARRILRRDQRQSAPPKDPNIYPLF